MQRSTKEKKNQKSKQHNPTVPCPKDGRGCTGEGKIGGKKGNLGWGEDDFPTSDFWAGRAQRGRGKLGGKKRNLGNLRQGFFFQPHILCSVWEGRIRGKKGNLRGGGRVFSNLRFCAHFALSGKGKLGKIQEGREDFFPSSHLVLILHNLGGKTR